MAKLILTAAYLALNGTDRASNASKAELAIEVDEKDVTTFASAGWKEVLGGLKSGNLGVSFRNDLAAGALDEILFPLLGTVVTFEVRAVNSARSTANPAYTGSVLIKSLTPVSGSPGDVNEASYTWPTSGAIARQTS